MPLTQFSLSMNARWALSRDIAPFQPVTQSDQLTFSLSPLDLATYTDAFIASVDLLAGVSQDFNLQVFADFPGTVTTATKALSLVLGATGATTAIATYGPSPTNGLSWFLGGSNPTISVPSGGVFMFSIGAIGTPQAVSSSAKNIRVTNTGTGVLTAHIVVLLGP